MAQILNKSKCEHHLSHSSTRMKYNEKSGRASKRSKKKKESDSSAIFPIFLLLDEFFHSIFFSLLSRIWSMFFHAMCIFVCSIIAIYEQYRFCRCYYYYIAASCLLRFCFHCHFHQARIGKEAYKRKYLLNTLQLYTNVGMASNNAYRRFSPTWMSPPWMNVHINALSRLFTCWHSFMQFCK